MPRERVAQVRQGRPEGRAAALCSFLHGCSRRVIVEGLDPWRNALQFPAVGTRSSQDVGPALRGLGGGVHGPQGKATRFPAHAGDRPSRKGPHTPPRMSPRKAKGLQRTSSPPRTTESSQQSPHSRPRASAKRTVADAWDCSHLLSTHAYFCDTGTTRGTAMNP